MSDQHPSDRPKRADPPSPEVQRFLREQPPIPIPRRQPQTTLSRGAVVYPILGYRVISRLG